MKSSTAFLATFLLSSASASAQIATLQTLPATSLSKIEISQTPRGTIGIPSSSIARETTAGRTVHTNIRFLMPSIPTTAASSVQATAVGKPPFAGMSYETPASLACLYGLTAPTNGCAPDQVSSVATGGSRAIAIVGAFHYDNALADLTTASAQFGLPAPNLTIVYASGTKPASDVGWSQEAALDLQMVHAMAPRAKLFLVEAASNRLDDMMQAVDRANDLVKAAGGGQISMSWGSPEFSSEADYSKHFMVSGVVPFASTGDTVSPSFPAVLPNVVAVGGTSIARHPTTFAFVGEDSWTDAGSGFSAYIPRPSFQDAATTNKTRGIPDISAVGNPYTGVWVRYTPPQLPQGFWYVVGGTSVAAPIIAGIANASGKFASSAAAHNALIYGAKTAKSTALRITRTGDCGRTAFYVVAPSWNPCSGNGSPNFYSKTPRPF